MILTIFSTEPEQEIPDSRLAGKNSLICVERVDENGNRFRGLARVKGPGQVDVFEVKLTNRNILNRVLRSEPRTETPVFKRFVNDEINTAGMRPLYPPNSTETQLVRSHLVWLEDH